MADPGTVQGRHVQIHLCVDLLFQLSSSSPLKGQLAVRDPSELRADLSYMHFSLHRRLAHLTPKLFKSQLYFVKEGNAGKR